MTRIFSHLRNRHYLFIDVILFAITPAMAIALRLEDWGQIDAYARQLVIFTLIMVSWKPIVLYLNGIYERHWGLASTDALKVLLGASFMLAVTEIVVSFTLVFPSHLLGAGFPRSVPFIDAVLSILFLGGPRLLARLAHDRSSASRGEARRTLIVGAGTAGSMVMRELSAHGDLKLTPVGFADDDPSKEGLFINGVPVLGPISRLESILRGYKIQEVIVAIPSGSGRIIRSVHQVCKAAGVSCKTIPAIQEIITGTAKVSQIRDIQIEDLLRRGVVQTDIVRVQRLLAGRRVLVTGAGGSIGSELCRQITACKPSDIVLLGHGENSIFTIAAELRRNPDVDLHRTRIHTIIADLRDEDRMIRVMKRFRPEIVFHAAAHKHVGLMQHNLRDAVTNNVHGSRLLVDLAAEFDVERLVMISSDKAVNPTSVMGVTKRMAELVVQEAAMRTGKAFSSVRFGNVLGSRGSVIPIFKAQVAAGGPVYVTHKDVSRFFMTIPEAVQLVLQAGAIGRGGEVFVLDMGEPVKIVDMARDVIRLSGYKEGEDIAIEFTGLAPGEKMYEELFYDWENPELSEHDKIFVCRRPIPDTLEEILHRTGIEADHRATMTIGFASQLRRDVDRVIVEAMVGNEGEVLHTIQRIVPQFGLHAERVPIEKEGEEVPAARKKD
jgi:FlaA1/EpsC-like NDP-sugar epimerase